MTTVETTVADITTAIRDAFAADALVASSVRDAFADPTYRYNPKTGAWVVDAFAGIDVPFTDGSNA